MAKFETSHEDIIKDIIKYRNNKNNIKRDKLIAKVVALGLSVLSQDESFDIQDGRGIMIDTAKDIEYNTTSRKDGKVYIELKDDMFKNDYTHYEDLAILFHETRHAVDNFVLGDKYIATNATDVLMQRGEVVDFLRRVVDGQGYYKKSSVELSDIEIYRYLKANYENNPVELNAERFSIKMMEQIVTYANAHKNDKENPRYRLNKFGQQLAEQKEQYSKSYLTNLSVINKYGKDIKTIAREARASVMSSVDGKKSVLDEIAEMDDIRYIEELGAKGNVYKDMLLSLLIDYDENDANCLADNILKQDGFKWRVNVSTLGNLMLDTSFRLSDEKMEMFLTRGSKACGDSLENWREFFEDNLNCEMV